MNFSRAFSSPSALVVLRWMFLFPTVLQSCSAIRIHTPLTNMEERNTLTIATEVGVDMDAQVKVRVVDAPQISTVYDVLLSCRGGVQRRKPSIYSYIRRQLRKILRNKYGTTNFIVWNGLAYMILHRIMIRLGPVVFIEWSNWIVFAFWWISNILHAIFPNTSIFQQMSEIMHYYFLTPRKWKVLHSGTRPLAAFGGSFSHIDPGHIMGNFSLFRIIAPDTLSMLGSSNFSHLYLISSLTSSLVPCLWMRYAPREFSEGRGRDLEEVTLGLGASGAISGMLAFWCCESHVRMKRARQQQRQSFYNSARTHSVEHLTLAINGKEVKPLMLLLSYTFADVGGLLHSKTIMDTAEYITSQDDITVLDLLRHLLHPLILDNHDNTADKNDKKVKENIGYDAHLGGYLGGILCYSVFRWLGKVKWFNPVRPRSRW